MLKVWVWQGRGSIGMRCDRGIKGGVAREGAEGMGKGKGC